MAKPERRDPAKERYWRRLLGVWRHSGLTVRDFCAVQGLSEPSFYAWRREIARRNREGVAAPERTRRRQTARRKNSFAQTRESGQANKFSPAQKSAQATKAAAPPAFVRVAVDGAPGAPPTLEVVLAQGRRLQVRPGFDAELLRQLLRVLEEPAC